MTFWGSEDEYVRPATATLPPTQESSYMTPTRLSKMARGSITPPGTNPSSPPPMPSNGRHSPSDLANDESISILDPRRFTPTLHANLVSEILALRRDQEEKNKVIEGLEASLQTTREEQESMQRTWSTTAKETRSLKRQLALLEGGTSSALGELAKERDEAIENAAEMKRRLEAAQKKLRNQEEDSRRLHKLWARDKDSWEDEKRKFERKNHVAESRLKSILDEVASYQAARPNGHIQPAHHNAENNENDETSKEVDAASVRTMSITNSIRFSILSGQTPSKPIGHSLADELNFDGDSDYQSDHDGHESVLSSPQHKRSPSRDSAASRIHQKKQSNESMRRIRILASQENSSTRVDGNCTFQELGQSPKAPYVDSGTQYSPPPSPRRKVVSRAITPDATLRKDRIVELESSPRGEWEVEANQSRKRVHIDRSIVIDPRMMPYQMVSASSQTMEEPLSPPKTPQTSYGVATPSPLAALGGKVMVSSFTQTETAVGSPYAPPAPLSIPSISIHPPTSRPATPREPRLPQYVKDAGCQVSMEVENIYLSKSVQTEEIRIDKRLALLPPHLRPGAISSRPPSPDSPVAFEDGSRHFTPIPGHLPPRNPRRLTSKRSITDSMIPSSPTHSPPMQELQDAYPGNNDDGPLSTVAKAPMRRPHRVSSLFAGFDAASSDEVDEFVDDDMSDSEFRTALSAPKPKSESSRSAKRSPGGNAAALSEQTMTRQYSGKIFMRQPGDIAAYSTSNSANRQESTAVKPALKSLPRTHEKPTLTGVSSKTSIMRKAAMIQNGIATHAGRPRSPSLPESRDPPFPIPTRASSRKPPISASAPSDGQRSPTRVAGDSWHRRGLRNSIHRANSIRKVRSAAAIPRSHRYRRRGSRSPPPFSASTEAPESPSLPPMPFNDITSPRNQETHMTRYALHRPELSTNTANTNGTDIHSQASSSQTKGVVDAIAQTMVGEWMFKYVRRRKSFGVPEGSAKDDNSNDRHKRWVWLAPYERAILWSSKQPTSGTALMGKAGRKLAIQSVLDVKDDNPSPKGQLALFNRSILILTPQRALKFTAISAERHYVWLTALSFLAHSSQAVPEIIATHTPKALPDYEPSRTKLRKSGIRDSIRLAKGKNAFSKSSPSSIPQMPSIVSSLSSPLGDGGSFRQQGESFTAISSSHTRETSREAAEPPFVPRFHERASPTVAHGRKRSNTGGHVPPPLSFRGFSGPAGSVSSYGGHHTQNSIGTVGSSDIYQTQASNHSVWGLSSGGGSQRTSEASSQPGNFFDAIGTVRMEAFISPLAFSRSDEYADEQEELRKLVRRRSKELRRRTSRSRQRDSYHSRGTRGTDEYYAGSRPGGEEDYFSTDPFKGF